MNRTTCIRNAKRLALGLAVIALAAAPSFAQTTTIDLCASDGSVTMPDGAVVPIWGYADITGGGACVPGLATLPGPVLEAADGDLLTINLSNALSVPVSVFIPGLAKDVLDPLAPQKTTDPRGRERLTSLDDTVPAGGTAGYSWSAREGTFLYHSGTDLRTQVPMGMYGALVVTGGGYPTVDQDEVLVYSEIDPALNANPAGFGGARVSSWIPRYFLINGAAYAAANPPIAISTSTDVLLRFVNAGLETFVPTLGGGLYMDVIAEDGNLYPYPLTQYGIELVAGKTMDAVVNAGADGTYAIYDRSLHLANGGQIAELQAGAAAGAPTAMADSYSVDEDGTLITLAGDLTFPGVLDNDTGGAAAAVLVSGPAYGSLVGGLAADGSFTYQPDADFFGTDQFTYVANDGLGGPDSNVATATITVIGVNDGPTAVADAYDVVEGSTLTVAAPGVLANDTDPDGDTLAVTTTPIVATTNGTLTLHADGSFEYTPSVVAPSSDSFTYEACDAAPLCSNTVVTLNIIQAPTPVNEAPIANNDTTSTPKNTPLVGYNIVANDEDPDGTIDPTSVVITTGGTSQRGGIVTNNGDGTVTYTPPNPGFRGTDTFQYTVNDNDGATSNVAIVQINVVK